MPEKRKRLSRIFFIALAAGVLTLAASLAMANWGTVYREIPENASEWKTPENEEVQAKVEEISQRILSGGNYGFDDLLYVLDHDSAAGEKVIAYLTEQGKLTSSLPQ